MTVRSSPFRRGARLPDASAKSRPRQRVPWSLPSSRYFHDAPFSTSTERSAAASAAAPRTLRRRRSRRKSSRDGGAGSASAAGSDASGASGSNGDSSDAVTAQAARTRDVGTRRPAETIRSRFMSPTFLETAACLPRAAGRRPLALSTGRSNATARGNRSAHGRRTLQLEQVAQRAGQPAHGAEHLRAPRCGSSGGGHRREASNAVEAGVFGLLMKRLHCPAAVSAFLLLTTGCTSASRSSAGDVASDELAPSPDAEGTRHRPPSATGRARRAR